LFSGFVGADDGSADAVLGQRRLDAVRVVQALVRAQPDAVQRPLLGDVDRTDRSAGFAAFSAGAAGSLPFAACSAALAASAGAGGCAGENLATGSTCLPFSTNGFDRRFSHSATASEITTPSSSPMIIPSSIGWARRLSRGPGASL